MAGRVLAACGSAVLMANCMTGARELFHDPVWRNRAIGIIVSATTLAFVIGMPLVDPDRSPVRLARGVRRPSPSPSSSSWPARFVLPASPRVRRRRPRGRIRWRRFEPCSAMAATRASARRPGAQSRALRGVAGLLRRLHDRGLRRLGRGAERALPPGRGDRDARQQPHPAAAAPLRSDRHPLRDAGFGRPRRCC